MIPLLYRETLPNLMTLLRELKKVRVSHFAQSISHFNMGEEATQKKQKRRRGKHRDDDQPQAADPASIVNQKDSASEGVKIAVKNDNITIDRPPLQPLDLRLSRINKETVDYFKNIEQFLLDPDHGMIG
jgi:hypothetical protein